MCPPIEIIVLKLGLEPEIATSELLLKLAKSDRVMPETRDAP
jgi:hypothetical protein